MIASSTITRHCVINLHYVRSWPSNFCIEYLTSPGSPFPRNQFFGESACIVKLEMCTKWSVHTTLKILLHQRLYWKLFCHGKKVYLWNGISYNVKILKHKTVFDFSIPPISCHFQKKKKWQFLYAFQIRKRTRRNEVVVGSLKPFWFCLRV